MNNKKIIGISIFMVFLILFMFLFFSGQLFTVIQLSPDATINMNSRDNSVFKFAGWSFEPQVQSSITTFSGCKTIDFTGWKNLCKVTSEGFDQYGCEIKRGWRATYSCPSPYRYNDALRMCIKSYGGNRKIPPTVSCVGGSTKGGALFDDIKEGCFWSGDLKYNGQVIDSIDPDYPGGLATQLQTFYLTEDGQSITPQENYDFLFKFGSTAFEGGVCTNVGGKVTISINAFDFNFTIDSVKELILGESADIKVLLNQNNLNMRGELIVQDEVINVEVNKGNNIYEVSLDELKSDKLDVELKMFYNTEGWTSAQSETFVGTITETLNVTVIETEIDENETDQNIISENNDEIGQEEISEDFLNDKDIDIIEGNAGVEEKGEEDITVLNQEDIRQATTNSITFVVLVLFLLTFIGFAIFRIKMRGGKR